MKRRDSAVYAIPGTGVESNHRHTDFHSPLCPTLLVPGISG